MDFSQVLDNQSFGNEALAGWQSWNFSVLRMLLVLGASLRAVSRNWGLRPSLDEPARLGAEHQQDVKF